jgi:adenosylcobyric acid synthase
MVIIPGSKNTISDLLDLRERGLEKKTVSFYRSGGMVAGICGGYQMLGRVISDPFGVESSAGSVAGMGILDAETILYEDKVTALVEAEPASGEGGSVSGYEIHMGRTALGENASPLFLVKTKNGVETSYEDGAKSTSGRAWGTYMHGLFENDQFRRGLLAGMMDEKNNGNTPGEVDYSVLKERGLELLADHVEKNIDLETIISSSGLKNIVIP